MRFAFKHALNHQVCANVLIGGHYWTPDTASGPWANVRYNSDSAGRTQMHIHLPGGNEYDYQRNFCHSLVIHRSDGERIACGILYYAEGRKVPISC
jgi:hypothetical protein